MGASQYRVAVLKTRCWWLILWAIWLKLVPQCTWCGSHLVRPDPPALAVLPTSESICHQRWCWWHHDPLQGAFARSFIACVMNCRGVDAESWMIPYEWDLLNFGHDLLPSQQAAIPSPYIIYYILYIILLYYIILSYLMLYYNILSYLILYYIIYILYYIILYYIILYYMICLETLV